MVVIWVTTRQEGRQVISRPSSISTEELGSWEWLEQIFCVDPTRNQEENSSRWATAWLCVVTKLLCGNTWYLCQVELGHIQRMDQARPTRKLLDRKPMGTRPVGKPRQRWQEDVTEDLKKLKVKNWKEAAKDRRTWRDWVGENPQRVVVQNGDDDDMSGRSRGKIVPLGI